MIFWTGVVLALIAAAMTAKKGLYDTWTLLFNVVIAVYLGLTVGPVMKDLLDLGGSGAQAFVIFGTAVVCLTVLYIFSYIIFLSQFNVSFPAIIDRAGGALFGFLAGLLIWSFIAFLIFISPLSQNNIINRIGFNKASLQKNTGYMKWWTGKVHVLTSADNKQQSIINAVETLVQNAEKAAQNKPTVDKPKQIEPVEQTVEEKKITPEDLGPPPELKSEDI